MMHFTIIPTSSTAAKLLMVKRNASTGGNIPGRTWVNPAAQPKVFFCNLSRKFGTGTPPLVQFAALCVFLNDY